MRLIMFDSLIQFNIRVTDDDKHCIFVQDFDAFEEFLIGYCLTHLNENVKFTIKFRTVSEDEEEIPF